MHKSGILKQVFNKQLILTINIIVRSAHSSSMSSEMDLKQVDTLSKKIVPSLVESKYKGQAGRIGVFGGSLEYTGAPYFAAISAVRVGADLSHVFCTKAAAPVIKSYSPELIVHPLLDDESAILKIEPWLDRLHVIVIGPGLGREPSTFSVIDSVISICRQLKKPLVIDADGLFFINQNVIVLKDYPAPVILTPNAVEFLRLIKADKIEADIDKKQQANEILKLSPNITIFCKGRADEIFNSKTHVQVSEGGSARRCGGQGDLLSGSIATFLAWSLKELENSNCTVENRPIVAAYSGSILTRRCNERAFQKYGRSMLVEEMIKEIHNSFEELFELKQ